MRVLLTGADGMLASNLILAWDRKFDLYLTGNRKNSVHSGSKYLKFDLKNKNYDYLLNWSKPDIIVHCAAITQVDYCENNQTEASKVNSLSCHKLTQRNDYTKRIIYISTDAVFNGAEKFPCESSLTTPINFYGKTKLNGEVLISDSGIPFTIIRTTILGVNRFYPSKTLVEWIYSSLKNKASIKLFGDTYFTPISSLKLAEEIEHVILYKINGLLHISGTTSISKYQFGCKFAKYFHLDQNLIQKSLLKHANFNAPRSLNQSLSVAHYQKSTGRPLHAIEGTMEDFSSLLAE